MPAVWTRGLSLSIRPAREKTLRHFASGLRHRPNRFLRTKTANNCRKVWSILLPTVVKRCSPIRSCSVWKKCEIKYLKKLFLLTEVIVSIKYCFSRTLMGKTETRKLMVFHKTRPDLSDSYLLSTKSYDMQISMWLLGTILWNFYVALLRLEPENIFTTGIRILSFQSL